MVKTRLKVDELGRITIPIEIRRMLGIKPREFINVEYDNESVVIPIQRENVNRELDTVIKYAIDKLDKGTLETLGVIFDRLQDEE